jgi:hypothetical protein
MLSAGASGSGNARWSSRERPVSIPKRRDFPDDPASQLRADPIDRGKFLRQPRMRPSFHALGLRLIAPTGSQITADDVLEIEIARPAGIELRAGRATPVREVRKS